MVERVARAHDAHEEVRLAAFEAGWGESPMNNLPCGHGDSVGVFQQRPSQGWGTVAQLMAPVYATTQFVVRAIANDRAHPGYTAGELAQRVQRSGYPERYDEQEATARALMAKAERIATMRGGSPTDFDGDGRDDIVRFTQNAAVDAFVATSTGERFEGGAEPWRDSFGTASDTVF